MRDILSLDSSTTCIQLEQISIKGSSEWKQLTTSVMNNPNFLDRHEFRFSIPTKLNEVYALAIMSWYIGELGIVLREDIREKYEHQLEDNIALTMLLSSRAMCEVFILDTHLWHSRTFYGNILNIKTLRNILKRVRWIKKPKARYLQRKRGYHDKGSMTLFPRTAYSDVKFVDLTREHLLLELKRRTHSDTINFIQGWYT